MDRLLDPEAGDWINVRRTYDGAGYSPLSQINSENVDQLRVAWAYSFSDDTRWAPNPVVANGIIYVSESGGKVHAIDAATGRAVWVYQRQLPEDISVSQAFNRARGVAVAYDKVYYGTADSYLVALDARTGEVVWETMTGDYKTGRGHSHPPIVADGKVIIGMNGGEFKTRGTVQAFDAETGELVWQVYTVPERGEPGSETWAEEDEIWGGATWGTPTYDPETQTVYIATGQPLPWSGLLRGPGDNLYTNSILALDVDTGEMKWYFQTLPHDYWDLDSPFESVLVDLEIDGEVRKALVHHTKTGWGIVLDRVTGEFLHAYQIAYQNVIEGWDENGRPIFNPEARPGYDAQNSGERFFTCPHLHGARNVHQTSYSPDTGLIYQGVNNHCMNVEYVDAEYRPGRLWVGFRYDTVLAPGYDHVGEFAAFDPATGERKWTYVTESGAPMSASALTTAGNLVFGGTTDREFFALDATTGELLWSITLNGDVTGSPITFMVDGKQYVAIGAGGTVAASTSFAPLVGLRTQPGSGVLWVFELPESATSN
jgi:alcohol dehydrogenase (cytochrome c)